MQNIDSMGDFITTDRWRARAQLQECILPTPCITKTSSIYAASKMFQRASSFQPLDAS